MNSIPPNNDYISYTIAWFVSTVLAVAFRAFDYLEEKERDIEQNIMRHKNYKSLLFKKNIVHVFIVGSFGLLLFLLFPIAYAEVAVFLNLKTVALSAPVNYMFSGFASQIAIDFMRAYKKKSISKMEEL